MFATSVGRSLFTDNIFCSRMIVLGVAVAFLRESYTFVYVIFLAASFSCAMFWFIPPIAVYAQCKCVDCLRVCVFALSLFGLVQALFSDWLISLDNQK